MDPPFNETLATVHPNQGDGGELPFARMDVHEEPVSLKTQGKDLPDKVEESTELIGEEYTNEFLSPSPVSVTPTVFSVDTHEESQGNDAQHRFEEDGQLIREGFVTDGVPHPGVVSLTSTMTPVDDTENVTELPVTETVTEFFSSSKESGAEYEGVHSEVFTEDVNTVDDVIETTNVDVDDDFDYSTTTNPDEYVVDAIESTTPSVDVDDDFEYSTTISPDEYTVEMVETTTPNVDMGNDFEYSTTTSDEYVTDRLLDYDLDSFTTGLPVLDDITTVLDASYDAVSGVMDSGTVLLSPTLYSQKIRFEYGEGLSSKEARVHIRPNRIFSGSGITSSTDALFDVGDSRITTFPSTLDIDSSGSFDPSLISKATNFQATHYSTTTRSATVTTTISRDNLVELSLEHMSTGLYCNCNTSNGTSDPISRSLKSNCSCNIMEANVHISGQVGEKQMELHTESTEDYITTTESFVDDGTTEVEDLADATEESTGTPVYGHETTEILSVIHGKITGVPVAEINVTTKESVSRSFINASAVSSGIGVSSHSNRSYIFDIQNGTYTKNAVKKPLDVHTSGISNIESSTGADTVNFPLGVTVISVFSALLLAVMILGMLLLRRRYKNHSKVYLSFEAKPRAMFTRPMRPALLPTEIGQVNLHPHDVPRPRAPILLLEESQCGSGEQTGEPSPNQDGVDNVAFVEIPLEELNSVAPVAKDAGKACDPPRYSPDIQVENDTDSGIRVWSSTGSLHSLSPSLSRCTRPPPPYTPESTYINTQSDGSRHIDMKFSCPDRFVFRKDRQSSKKHEAQSETLNKTQGKELPCYSDILGKTITSETSHSPVPVHDWNSLSETLKKVTVAD
ncbi:uncharacterized protein LOC143038376 [Oratosquilla oratoria]|uniref:uncharacterized protein LOC143038376 n=1 Tax=Oratosquilla oratoria TaxID=337810 RepID=UPI003F758CE4